MQLKTLLPAAALALSANAFLLPPDVKGEALEAFQAVPDSNNHWTAHVDCAGCPVAQDKEDESGPRGFIHAAELDSDLILDFATNDQNEITFAGVPIYPPRPAPGAFTVKQVLKEGGDGMVSATEDDLSVSSRMDFGQRKLVDEDGTSIVPFTMEIIGVENKVVHADSVTFNILQDTEGHVYISNPQTVPSPTTPLDAACTSIFCRVKAQLFAKVAATKAKVGAFAKGCMRKMGFKHGHPHGGHRRPQNAEEAVQAIKDKIEEMKPDQEKVDDIRNKLHGGVEKFRGKFGKKPCPGKMGKHGHGHPHHHHHGTAARIMHVIARFTQHVVMPIMVGIAAGMAVSALGMLIGQIVFMIWMRIKGRRQGMVAVYHIIESSDTEGGPEDEQLPVYEEKEGLPAYTDGKTEI